MIDMSTENGTDPVPTEWSSVVDELCANNDYDALLSDEALAPLGITLHHLMDIAISMCLPKVQTKEDLMELEADDPSELDAAMNYSFYVAIGAILGAKVKSG